jgi:hypothetical protein
MASQAGAPYFGKQFAIGVLRNDNHDAIAESFWHRASAKRRAEQAHRRVQRVRMPSSMRTTPFTRSSASPTRFCIASTHCA